MNKLLLFCVSLSFSMNARALGVAAEWDPVRTVLVHTPGDEVFFGVLHPDAALYNYAFSLDGARAEHQQYIKRLQNAGANVITIRDVLLDGTLDSKGQPVEGSALNNLRDFAASRLTYDISKAVATYAATHKISIQRAKAALTQSIPNISQCTSEISKFSEQYKRLCVINKLHPNELVRIIMTKPTVNLDISTKNTDTLATYTFAQPEMNLYFVRDPMITTERGVILGKMSSTQRAGEPEIIRFVLAKMNVPIVYEVAEPGRLEGGDYMPAGRVAFIGNGLRTNTQAIRQLLSRDLFGNETIVVINDQLQSQDQMHLDTYFNVLSDHFALLANSRLRDAHGNISPRMRLTVDLWTKSPSQGDVVAEKLGPYSKVASGLDFQDYMEKTLHYFLLPISDPDQLNDGTNLLTISSKQAMVVNGLSPGYYSSLTSAGASIQVVDFTNLFGGWGATHCTTQVLDRH